MGLGLEVVGVDTQKFKEFNSRREVERYIKQMNKFLDRNYTNFTVTNPHGATLNYSTVKQAQKEIRRINRIKKKEMDRYGQLPFKDRGMVTSFTAGEQGIFGDNRFQDMSPLTFNPKWYRSQKELDQWLSNKKEVYKGDFINRIHELYKENYVKALQNVFGRQSKDLQRIVEDMDTLKFIELYYTENVADINFIYDFQEAKAKLNVLKGVFEQ